MCLLLFAVGLVLAGNFIGQASGYYAAKADNYSINRKAATAENLEVCFSRAPAPAVQECVEREVVSGRDDQRSEQDLSAQQQMAKWAYWLLILTIAQSLLGIFGFVALVITIRQGRDANEIARNGSHRELRAYLASASVTIEEVDSSSSQYAMNMMVANHGQTPANISNVIFRALWHFGDGGTEVIREERNVRLECHKVPEMRFEFKFSGVFDGCEKPGIFMVGGSIIYKDVFGKQHAEQFGWMMDAKDKAPFLFLACPIPLGAYSPEVVEEMLTSRQQARGVRLP